MLDLRRTLHLITRKLPEGLWLAEVLHFPEVSRLGPLRRAVHRELLREIERRSEKLPPDAAYFRHGGGPVEVRRVTVALAWEGPSVQVSQPIELPLTVVVTTREENAFHGYVPALDLDVFATTTKKLDRLLELEIRRALKRTGIERDPLRLALLARAAEADLEAPRRTLHVCTATEHRRRQEQELRMLMGDKPVLPQVATPLRPRRCKEAFEVDELVERIAGALTGAGRASVLLVGASGVGKTAAALEAIRRSRTLLPAVLEFWETSGSRLVAGAGGFGMLQERLIALERELIERKAVLLLGNLFELVQVGRACAESEGASAVLQPMIARGRIRTLAECTPEQADVLERREPRLLAAFTRLDVREPDAAGVMRILHRCAERAAARRTIVIDPSALDRTCRLHRRYSGTSAFPGKATLFLQSLIAEGGPQALIGEEEAVAAFAEQSGLPRFLLDDAMPLDVEGVRRWFRTRIFGQDEAVDVLVDLIVSVKAGLGRVDHPLASLLFVGPTGVGKTETAKALAEFFFGDRTRMARFDMSEYSSPAGAARLIGGSGDAEGLLTSRIREQPFQVVLLDEIEKADARVFDLLLQVLGEGRLTDAGGRTADFRNAVIILTSNLGADTFRAGHVGFRAGDSHLRGAQDHFREEVRRFFRPELFNRLDRLVPFLPLSAETLRALAARELEQIRQRSGVLDRKLALEVPDDAVEAILARGTDVAYGARPLKRAFERALVSPLAAGLNEFAWDQPLAAGASMIPGQASPGITVRGIGVRGTTDSSADSSAAVEALCDVRRRLQRFRDHPLYIRLEDELAQLLKIQEQVMKPRRGRAAPTALLLRLKALKPMQSAQETFARLATEMETAEEAAILRALKMSRDDSPADAAYAAEVGRRRMRNVLLQVLALEVPDPHRAHLLVYGEPLFALPSLVEGYVQAARILGAESMRLHYWVRRPGRKQFDLALWSAEPDPADLRPADADVPGALLEIHADQAMLRLQDEAGIHVFKRKDLAGACRVEVRPWQLTIPEPPAGVGKTVDAPKLSRRREYDFDQRKTQDRRLEVEILFRRTELGVALAEAIEKAVDLRIDEMTRP